MRSYLYVGALALLMVAPVALADVAGGPVRGDAWADVATDAEAVLAQVDAYDPSFHLEFTYLAGTLYEVRIPRSVDASAPRAPVGAPAAPEIVSAREVSAGRLALDPRHASALLLAADPRGLSLRDLPLQPPEGPADFAIGRAAPVLDQARAGEVRPTFHDLEVGESLRYTIHGLAVHEPARVEARGDLLAVVARGVVVVEDAKGASVHRLGPGADGHRVLLLQARDARALIEGEGLLAVAQPPKAALGAGVKAAAEIAGREVGTAQEAGVASDGRDVALAASTGVAGRLAEAPAGSGDGAVRTSAAAEPSLLGDEAAVAAAGALAGGLAALAAVGAASLWASGKVGLFTLLAPLYARLQNDEILRNQAREAIFRLVVENPGVNVSEVVKHFGLGWGATVYHLRVLERNHLVVASKQGRQVCYFQNGGRYSGQMAGISALRNANAALVARTLLERPGIQQREVCKATGLAQPTVSWHLQRLEEAGLVASDGAARKRYAPLPPLVALAQRGLVPSYAAPAEAARAVTASAAPPAPATNA